MAFHIDIFREEKKKVYMLHKDIKRSIFLNDCELAIFLNDTYWQFMSPFVLHFQTRLKRYRSPGSLWEFGAWSLINEFFKLWDHILKKK